MAKNRIAAMAFIGAGIGVFLILAVIMMILGHGLLATLLLGMSLIVGGVLGLVISRNPRFGGQPVSSYPAGQSAAPASRQNAAYPTDPVVATPPAAAPANTPQPAKKDTSIGFRQITDMVTKAWNAKDFGAVRISVRVMLVASGFLLVIALLLLCNLLVSLRPWFTVHETQIVACREAPAYTKEGWRVTSSYSYEVEATPAVPATYTACVIERDRFVWSREKRAEKTKTLENMPEGTPTGTLETPFDSSLQMRATATPTPPLSPTDETPPTVAAPPTTMAPPPTTIPPTMTPLPTAPPPPTITPLPTVTPAFTPDSPVPTPPPPTP